RGVSSISRFGTAVALECPKRASRTTWENEHDEADRHGRARGRVPCRILGSGAEPRAREEDGEEAVAAATKDEGLRGQMERGEEDKECERESGLSQFHARVLEEGVTRGW